jgi:hypothetical protein
MNRRNAGKTDEEHHQYITAHSSVRIGLFHRQERAGLHQVGPSGEAPVVTDYFNQFVPGMVINLTEESVNAYSHSYYGGYLRMIQIAPQAYVDSI